MPVIRKTIYTIGILMFLSGPLHPWTGLAADNGSDKSCNVINDPGCRLTSRLEYALRGKENEGLDWGNSFGENNPEKIGQNLYLLIKKYADRHHGRGNYRHRSAVRPATGQDVTDFRRRYSSDYGPLALDAY